MRVFLPESVGQLPGDGKPIDYSSLYLPELTEPRRELAQRIEEAALNPQALEIFHAGPRSVNEVGAMSELRSRPCGQARRVYTGVLYEAAGFDTLIEDRCREIGDALLIMTGAFGPVRLTDDVAAARCAATCDLPGVGVVATWWKKHLAPHMATPQIVLDCCSAPYQRMWRPPAREAAACGLEAYSLGVKVVTKNGLKTVSHWAKHYRGIVAGALARSPKWPTTLDELLSHTALEEVNDMIDAVVEGEGPYRTLTLIISSSSRHGD
ncbi:MAG: peroxide stress protein YaaA [Actinomycetaceae bacterium]|nr:peroxide stress protein YaaA [Actinomycetaceae bacterium]